MDNNQNNDKGNDINKNKDNETWKNSCRNTEISFLYNAQLSEISACLNKFCEIEKLIFHAKCKTRVT